MLLIFMFSDNQSLSRSQRSASYFLRLCASALNPSKCRQQLHFLRLSDRPKIQHELIVDDSCDHWRIALA